MLGKLKKRLHLMIFGVALIVLSFIPVWVQRMFVDSDMPGIVFFMLPLAFIGLLIFATALVLLIADLFAEIVRHF